MMFRRSICVMAVGLLLAGCVLQSDKPVYSEADGTLVLKTIGQRFGAESFADGAWKAEDGEFQFSEAGHHYVVKNSKDDKTAEALFAGAGSLSMLQFSEAGKPSTYVIAEVQKGAVLLRPVFCSDLKKAHISSAVLTFTDNDCKLTAAPKAAEVKAWAAALGDAKMRMVPKT